MTEFREFAARSLASRAMFCCAIPWITLGLVGCGESSEAGNVSSADAKSDETSTPVTKNRIAYANGTLNDSAPRDWNRKDPKYRSPQIHPARLRGQYGVALPAELDEQASALLDRVSHNLSSFGQGSATTQIEKGTVRIGDERPRYLLTARFVAPLGAQEDDREFELLFLWKNNEWIFFSGTSWSPGDRENSAPLRPEHVEALVSRE